MRRVPGQLIELGPVSNFQLRTPGRVRYATCERVVRMVNPDRDNRRNANAHTDPDANHLARGWAYGLVPARGIIWLATTGHDSGHQCHAHGSRDRPSR